MPLSSAAVNALLARTPQIALGFALLVFTINLFLAISAGTGISQPFNMILIALMALAVAFAFLAQNPNNENAALLFWFGAGVWGAAAFLNFQFLGLVDLVLAAMAAGSAFLIERESRLFSFSGPALFLGTGLSLVILSNILTR